MSVTLIRAVVYREVTPETGEAWVVQGVDFDIASQGKTARDACYDFGRILPATHLRASEKHGLQPFENLPHGPKAL